VLLGIISPFVLLVALTRCELGVALYNCILVIVHTKSWMFAFELFVGYLTIFRGVCVFCSSAHCGLFWLFAFCTIWHFGQRMPFVQPQCQLTVAILRVACRCRQSLTRGFSRILEWQCGLNRKWGSHTWHTNYHHRPAYWINSQLMLNLYAPVIGAKYLTVA